jgi:lipoyl(octanoyl) transferase
MLSPIVTIPKPETWGVLDTGPRDYAFNMALDEALLEAVSRLGTPALRFYGWTQPAASFGYFQHYAEVERWTPLRPLVRRPTAGGIVPHDADWTYSLAFPPAHAWYSLTARQSYRRVHEWIQAAFERLGVVTVLAPQASKTGLGQCFVGYEEYDLLWQGRKIAGAAQRRRRDGLLIQGSVQPPPLGIERVDWQGAMREAGQELFGADWVELPLEGSLLERAHALATRKYSQETHNRAR